KRYIEVARSEAERAAAVGADDLLDVVRARGLLGAPHAGGTVVIRGQRERPGPEDAVVVLEKLSGGFRGSERVQPIVHFAIDPEVPSPGRTHELPETRGTDLGICRRVERGLHVRQHCELRRQAAVRKRLRNVRRPGTSADQPLPEAVRLAELEADLVRGLKKALTRALLAPQIADALLFARQLTRAGSNLA